MRTNPWLPTKRTAEKLGIKPRRLWDLRKQGLFKLGTHYRILSAPGAGRPTYQWHLQRCEDTLSTPLEKRG